MQQPKKCLGKDIWSLMEATGKMVPGAPLSPHTMHIRKHGTQAPLCGGGGGWGNVSQNQCTGKIYGSLIAVHSEHGRIYSQEGWIKM